MTARRAFELSIALAFETIVSPTLNALSESQISSPVCIYNIERSRRAVKISRGMIDPVCLRDGARALATGDEPQPIDPTSRSLWLPWARLSGPAPRRLGAEATLLGRGATVESVSWSCTWGLGVQIRVLTHLKRDAGWASPRRSGGTSRCSPRSTRNSSSPGSPTARPQQPATCGSSRIVCRWGALCFERRVKLFWASS